MIAPTIVILLMTLSLGMSISDHGKERKPTNGWNSLISYLLWFILLYCGDFFNY